MLVMGLAGILIILRPGLEHVLPATLVMLAGAFAYASTMIATKRIAGHDTAFALLFYMSAIQLPLIAAVGVLFYGEPFEVSIFLGAAVIFAGTYYSIRRERR